MNRSEYNTSVDQFSDSVYRFILKACRNKQMAEDIVQDSFFVLWEHVRELQYNKAKAFLFTTAYRKMIDQFRREKRNVDVSTIDSSQLTMREENIDLQEILEYALSRLSTIQQTVILLRDYEDYSYQEIAEITGLNESQVKVYIFRGRSSMKQFIRKSDLVI
ncbi:MAG: RNA polymerase sigma factor [Odoribacter sp.]